MESLLPLLRAAARFRDLANARQALPVMPFNSSGLDHLNRFNHLDHRQSLEIGLSALSVDTAREAESMG
jgi:hypothetical protein